MDILIGFLDKWQSLLGGLGGGILTYFGVLLTLNFQKKQEYPKKLILTTKMIFDLQDYIAILNFYLNEYKEKNFKNYDAMLSLKELREKQITKAADTDKQTYRVILDAFDRFLDKDYFEIFFMADREKAIKLGEMFKEDLILLQKELDKRVKFYEKKIKK